MSVRIYIGGLDPAVSQDEVEAECARFGKLASCWVARNPPGFAFVEYERAEDAEDAVEGLKDQRIGGGRVKVEIAKNRGKNSGPPPARGGPPPPPGGGGSTATKHRAVLKNLPASFSWKELKDEMRRIGDVIYADVDLRGDGIVEFANPDDLEYAVRRLDGSQLDGHTLVVYKERDGPPPPPPSRPYDDRRYDDRRYDDRRYDDRRYDDRRYDDRRYDDRRYDDRRSDDRRSDDRRSDDRRCEQRYEEERRDGGRGYGAREDRYARCSRSNERGAARERD
ncbi:hypothetical protein AB1Y20_014392 [Prymnesium parvum]|uniref:RRM domain-containing protein n=1 Tax=Prymnesium parvum TaxID=97485 RepID=A0AB34IG52_PRYPA